MVVTTPRRSRRPAAPNQPSSKPTSKVAAATLAAAIASIVFIVLAKVWPTLFTDAELATLQGAVTTVFAFIIGWWVKDPS